MTWMYRAIIILLIAGVIGFDGIGSMEDEVKAAKIQTRQNQSATDEQGLSEEYHGHKSNRPEMNGQKQSPPTVNNRLIQIQLLGINDLHGQLNVTRKVNGKEVGRADYLAAYLQQRKAENKNTLLVQVGDMIGASPPISALLQDEPTIDILNRIGFDIGTVGNHEFDRGVKELLRIINGGLSSKTGNFEGAEFPWIVANVINEKTGKSILPPYKIIKVNGIPIGFIGVVTRDTPNLVVPSRITGLKFTDEVEAINRNVAALKKQGVRAIVVLAHNSGTSGPNGENPTGKLVDIANRVDNEVDVIFGGHSHAYMNATINNKLVIQAYSYGTAFSDVDVEIDSKTKDIVSKKAEIVTTFHEGIKPDEAIKKMIGGYEATIAPKMNQVIGSTSVPLTAKQNENGESVLGDFIADAQRAALKTDFAFMNPGGIRANIAPGDITWGAVYTVQPFQNDLVQMIMTGKQIRDCLNQQWGKKVTMLQISGLTYTWDSTKPVGEKIIDIKLPDGQALDPNQPYSVTANIFLAEGGDGFTAFIDAKNKEIGMDGLNALVNFIRNQPKPFTYNMKQRIQKLR